MSRLHRISAKIAASSRVALSPMHEGEYLINHENIGLILQDILVCKYVIDNAYRSFSDRVRGPFRDALVEHWQEHAKEERQAAYDIAMKIVGLGLDPTLNPMEVPECSNDVEEMCKCLANLELDLIQKERGLINVCGDNTAMKVLGENLVLVDTQHLDDLRRMCLQYIG